MTVQNSVLCVCVCAQILTLCHCWRKQSSFIRLNVILHLHLPLSDWNAKRVFFVYISNCDLNYCLQLNIFQCVGCDKEFWICNYKTESGKSVVFRLSIFYFLHGGEHFTFFFLSITNILSPHQIDLYFFCLQTLVTEWNAPYYPILIAMHQQ